MSGNVERHIPQRSRRWTSFSGRRAALLVCAMTLQSFAAASPVAAVARPMPGGIDDQLGSNHGWSGWSIEPRRTVTGSQADREPPVIRVWVENPGPFAVGSAVILDFQCTDTGAGLRWCPDRAILDTSTAGPHSAGFQAVDGVGNVGSVIIAYTVVEVSPALMMIWPDPSTTWA